MKRIYSIAIALMTIAACTEPLNEKGELNGYEDIYDFSGIDTEDLVIKWDNDSDPSNIVLYGHVTNKVNIGCDFPWFGVFDKQTKKMRFAYTYNDRPLTAYGENIPCRIDVIVILDNFCVSEVSYEIPNTSERKSEIRIIDSESNYESVSFYKDIEEEEEEFVALGQAMFIPRDRELKLYKWHKDLIASEYKYACLERLVITDPGGNIYDESMRVVIKIKTKIYDCRKNQFLYEFKDWTIPFSRHLIHSKENSTRFDVISGTNGILLEIDEYTNFEKYASKSFEVFANANESDMFDWSEPEKTDYEISWSVTRTTYSGVKETKNVTVTIENGETIVKIV